MHNLDDENDSNFIPQTNEDRIISETKSIAFGEIKRWIESVTSKKFAFEDFRRSLSDGILLCNLLNCLKPGSIKRINKISTTIAGYENSPALDNIGNFLRSCTEDFGLSNKIMFETSDLEDLSEKQTDMTAESDRRLQRVLICLFHLAKSVENHLTTVILDQAPFRILLQRQDHNEMRRIKSNSISSDIKHDTSLSRLIQNQSPDYLATRAQETLNQTKVNQAILHRSVDDEEWQESLENWKEKRRQGFSNTALDDHGEHNGDTQQMVELKERARKMKLQREQFKDSNIILEPQSINKVTNGDNPIIPDIDDETKAMIERVKQKKIMEENKRRFSMSPPPNSSAFASDSELSTSTALEKHDDETLSTSEKAEIDGELSICQEPISSNLHEKTSSNPLLVTEEDIKNVVPVKTHLVHVKLNRRSKQDGDHWWGMDITMGVKSVTVSKVKIGSCADVCDVRKGDEIVSVNNQEVSDKSIEYVRSLLDQSASVISSPDTLNLCLRRTFNEDEEEDFFSSDQSEINDENDKNIIVDSFVNKNSKRIHEHEINYNRENLEETVQLDNIDSVLRAEETMTSTTSEIPSKSQVTVCAGEIFLDYKDDVSYPLTNDPIEMFADISNTTSKIDCEKENFRKQSVQEKIANIESQNNVNATRLSSSWNIPRTSSNDPLINNMKSNLGLSSEKLCWNSENNKNRQFGSGNSSLSNLYHYWETEAPKSVSSSQTNIIAKNSPLIQKNAPLQSLIGGKENEGKIEMEIVEQHMDMGNVKVEETWKTVHSSGNSSTSEDASALNDTTRTQLLHKDPRSINQDFDIFGFKSPVEEGKSVTSVNSTEFTASSSVNYQLLPSETLIVGRSFIGTNTSTGVQANLIQSRRPINYTNVTTSYEGRYNPPPSPATISVVDEDTSTITISNNQDPQFHNCPSTPESKGSTCQNLHSVATQNMNDTSKDYTTITAVSQANKTINEVNSSNPLATESTITPVSENNEKSVEIEISITPQLFPIRNRTLLSKILIEKDSSTKHNGVSSISDSSSINENTLHTDYVKMIDLDQDITPVKIFSKGSSDLANIPISSFKVENKIKPNNTQNLQSNGRQEQNELGKKHRKNNLTDLRLENSSHNSSKIIYSDTKSHSPHPSLDTDPTTSTLPAPSLFKNGPKSDNSQSLRQISSKSDNGQSKKVESILSSKKIKKSYTPDSNTLTESKRSASSKELRFEEISNDKEWNFINKDINKRRSCLIEDRKNNLSNDKKYSAPQFSDSRKNNTLPSTTTMKSHTKSYSIERSTKQVSFNETGETKTPQKSAPSIPNEMKNNNIKCNYCSTFVGLEDLMVIEELSLHFHLRCFLCHECKQPLGDGKSDTDVRIRRSKLHCMSCYNKKSSKSKHRLGQVASRPSQSLGNISHNKGGKGDGQELFVHASDCNSCVANTNISSSSDLSSFIAPLSATNNNNNNSALIFSTASQLQINYTDTF